MAFYADGMLREPTLCDPEDLVSGLRAYLAKHGSRYDWRFGDVFLAGVREHRVGYTLEMSTEGDDLLLAHSVNEANSLRALRLLVLPPGPHRLRLLPFCYGVKGIRPWGAEPLWSVDQESVDAPAEEALGDFLPKTVSKWLLPILAERPEPTMVLDLIGQDGWAMIEQASRLHGRTWEPNDEQVSRAAAAVAVAAAKFVGVPLLLGDVVGTIPRDNPMFAMARSRARTLKVQAVATRVNVRQGRAMARVIESMTRRPSEDSSNFVML